MSSTMLERHSSYEQARDELIKVVTELEQGVVDASSSRSPSGNAAKPSPSAARSGSSAPGRDSTPRVRGSATTTPRVSRGRATIGCRELGRGGRLMARREPAVVAELGRPETPQETADRKASASARHRSNQTAFNLVARDGGVAASSCSCSCSSSCGRRRHPATRVDYQSIAAAARRVDGRSPAGPARRLGRQRGAAGDRRRRSAPGTIGFVTPANQFIGLRAGARREPDLARRRRSTAPPRPAPSRIDGLDWVVYDRRDAEDPGNYEFALSAELRRQHRRAARHRVRRGVRSRSPRRSPTQSDER